MDPRLQAALAALPWPPAESKSQALRIAAARGLMAGYHEHWKSSYWQTLAVRQTLHLPILHPVTNRRWPRWVFAVQPDGLLTYRDQTVVLKHHLVQESHSPGSSFWQRLHPDLNASRILLATWLLGQRVYGVLYDVIRKPNYDPCQLNCLQTIEVRRSSQWCGRTLSPEVYRGFCLDPQRQETPEMFEARLAQDACRRPHWYFSRFFAPLLPRELLTTALELWQAMLELDRAQRNDDQRRNDDACFAERRPCEFLPLCTGRAQPTSPCYRRLDPPTTEQGDGAPTHYALTPERLRTFQACRRQHHYRYELGLVSDRPALPPNLAILMRQALAAWWNAPGLSSEQAA